MLASSVEALSAPDRGGAEVRHIEPPAERETGRDKGVRTQPRAPGASPRRARRRRSARAQLRPALSARWLAERMFCPRPFLVCRA